eukprot:1142657-Pelagomonas_calceolata.AAC.5
MRKLWTQILCSPAVCAHLGRHKDSHGLFHSPASSYENLRGAWALSRGHAPAGELGEHGRGGAWAWERSSTAGTVPACTQKCAVLTAVHEGMHASMFWCMALHGKPVPPPA